MNLYEEARNFADQAHAGQVRKYTGAPYITHPIVVAGTIASITDDIEMIAAAVLHDVVEDCEVSLPEIENRFGHRVSQFVSEVTDVSTLEDGNRAARKALDRQHLAQASAEGKTIKLADLIDNSPQIIQYDSKFAKVYLKENAALLKVLTEGDSRLFNKANDIVVEYQLRSQHPQFFK